MRRAKSVPLLVALAFMILAPIGHGGSSTAAEGEDVGRLAIACGAPGQGTWGLVLGR
jgi:hypothetical protein